MRVAIITTDGRADPNFPASDRPHFGTAVSALLEGFAMLAKEGKQKFADSNLELPNEEPRTTNEEPRTKNNEQLTTNAASPSSISHLPPPVPEIHVLSCLRSPLPSPEKLAGNIWFHPVIVPRWGWLRSGYLGSVVAVRNKLLEICPDIVHAQGTERECAIAGALSGYKRVLTIHGNLRSIRKNQGLPFGSPMWIQSFLEEMVIPHFEAHICISNYAASLLPRSTKRRWIIPNAVNSSFFDVGRKRVKPEAGSRKSESAVPPADLRSPISHLPPFTFQPSAFSLPLPLWSSSPNPPQTEPRTRNQEPRTKNQEQETSPASDLRPQTSDLRSPISDLRSPLLIVPAAIEPWKNQLLFIKAMDPVARDIPMNIQFVGADRGGGYSDHFHRMVAERPWCRYGGMLGTEELMQAMLSSTLLVLPSLEENCPMVILEAMAVGVPVAASNAGGIPDLIRDGETGMLFDPENATSIANVVSLLLVNRPLLDALAATAREDSEQKHDPTIVAWQHLDTYRKILDC